MDDSREVLIDSKTRVTQGMVTKSIYKFYVTFILVIFSVSFVFPFLWLVITSLKPIEQTMQMPPEWVPKAYFIVSGGKPVQVDVVEKLDEPTLLVAQLEGPEKGLETAISKKQFSGGRIRRASSVSGRSDEISVRVRVIRELPAGWIKVREKSGEAFSRAVRYVPPAEIETKIRFEWANYKKVLTSVPFGLYLKNTLIVCLLGVIGVLLSNSIVAYGFSKIEWPGRDALFVITLATMMIPFPVTMIPLYSVFKKFGMTGTLMPLWVPTFFGSAFNIFLLRQFFMTIPRDLIEAAKIDGCSELQIFFMIMLPLSKPVLAVCALFHFMGAWNDFMGPLIYLTDQRTFTLSLGLQFFQSQTGGTDWNLLMAASTMVVAPILVLFFLTQKTFVQGISMTGMKG